jgi:hypothetical protein
LLRPIRSRTTSSFQHWAALIIRMGHEKPRAMDRTYKTRAPPPKRPAKPNRVIVNSNSELNLLVVQVQCSLAQAKASKGNGRQMTMKRARAVVCVLENYISTFLSWKKKEAWESPCRFNILVGLGIREEPNRSVRFLGSYRTSVPI